jgi:hypothetical protein
LKAAVVNAGFAACISLRRPTAEGRLPTYMNGGWPAPQFMKLGCQKDAMQDYPIDTR